MKKQNENIHKEIIANKHISNRTMTKKQFEVLLLLVSKYEIKLPDITGWSVGMASDEIDSINKQVKQGALKLREKPYDVEYLFRMFECKYPETFNAIVKRKEDGIKKIFKYGLFGNGYDKEGFNKFGYDKEGYGRDGFNQNGYNREGYDRQGYDQKGFNRNG